MTAAQLTAHAKGGLGVTQSIKTGGLKWLIKNKQRLNISILDQVKSYWKPNCVCPKRGSLSIKFLKPCDTACVKAKISLGMPLC